MKRLILGSFILPLGTFAACTLEEPDTQVRGVAGTTSTSAGGSAGTSTAGTSTTGGAAGSFNPAGGSGGTPPLGGSGGTPPLGGSGGSDPQGGTGGSDAQGGSAGTETAGTGGTGPLTPADIVGALDGRLIMTPCGDQPSTDDCNAAGWRLSGTDTGGMVESGGCQQGRLEVVRDHPINGEPGREYQATMHFYGVMEPRDYQTVTRESQGTPNNADTGVNPPTWGWRDPGAANVRGSTYNNYEIHVFDNNQNLLRSYYLNACQGGCEGHHTYVINYEKTITIIGGGMVRLQIFDSNCRQIKNCGSTPGFPCASKARTLNLSSVDPQPVSLDQPALGVSNDHAGQWWFIDVTDVTPM